MRGLLTICLLAAVSALLAGCGFGADSKVAGQARPAGTPPCLDRAGWQKLANRIKAPVYCAGWLPDPLTGKFNAPDHNIASVGKDRSYLESWVWQETGAGAAGGELHVNLRGYPGVTKIPTCRTGGTDSKNVPCFDQPDGTVSANRIHATFYTVNQDADAWHIALLWHANGGLYTLSEHVAPPLTAGKVMQYLKRELRSLTLIKPT